MVSVETTGMSFRFPIAFVMVRMIKQTGTIEEKRDYQYEENDSGSIVPHPDTPKKSNIRVSLYIQTIRGAVHSRLNWRLAILTRLSPPNPYFESAFMRNFYLNLYFVSNQFP
jgi:hypothetical protein